MTSVKDAIRQDLKEAMKSGDATTRDTLRMVLAAVIHEQTTGKQASELNEEQFIALLVRETKKRQEAAKIYQDNSRQDLAEKELAEAQVISRYLPTPLSDEEVDALVERVVDELGLTQPLTAKDFGIIMKAAKDKAQGTVDGARLSAVVKKFMST